MSSPARSRPEGFDLAVVALSARSLAASARRAGLRALAIDLFADEDTSEHAALAVRAEPSRRGMGFDRKSLLAALAAHAPEGLPVALGAGFEHAPALMRAIATRNPVLGASPDQVKRLKDPFAFAALLGELDIPHPPVGRPGSSSAQRGRGTMRSMVEGATFQVEARTEAQAPYAPPPPPLRGPPSPCVPHGGGSRGGASTAAPSEPWLSKRVGASGGAHIRSGGSGGDAGRRRYLQTFIPGRPVSALFLADGRSIRIVGFSEQWADPAPRAPFRYGGAVGPIDLPSPLVDDIAAALGRIVAATGLAGLASADMIVAEGASFQLLEINPRPGATLDVFDRDETPSLLGLHLDACEGRLPGPLPAPDTSRAAAIVYAERPVRVSTLRRPLWTADWPLCDETLPAGAPVCTVLATAASPSAARALVVERRAALLASLRAASAAPKIANTNAMVPA